MPDASPLGDCRNQDRRQRVAEAEDSHLAQLAAAAPGSRAEAAGSELPTSREIALVTAPWNHRDIAGALTDREQAVLSLRGRRLVGDGRITMKFRPGPAPVELVSNVHVLPFLADGRCVLVRSREWGWMIPGGTCEPGETPLETAVREIREEAGAVLSSFLPVGADWGESRAEPYRAHLHHPNFCWLWGWGDAVLIGQPEPTAGGETIEEVASFAVDDAVEIFLSAGETVPAGLVDLIAKDRYLVLAARQGQPPA